MELKTIQKKIAKMEKTNGWKNSPDQRMTFLTEELGEVAKWVRKARKNALTKIEKGKLNLEFADVLQHLISLANDFGLDLEEGLKKKKKI